MNIGDISKSLERGKRASLFEYITMVEKEYCSKCQKQIDKEKKLKEEVEFMRTAPNLNESQITLIALYEQGKNLSEIAELMGISRQAVHGKYSIRNLKRGMDKIHFSLFCQIRF